MSANRTTIALNREENLTQNLTSSQRRYSRATRWVKTSANLLAFLFAFKVGGDPTASLG